MELSKRLEAVASLVDEGAIVADIGTDHAYVPIDLVRRGIVSCAIAMDVNEGPLKRAARHVRAAGLGDKIELRLSDGLGALLPKEADCVILAGMGGGLVMRILKAHMDVTRSLKSCVLQPQSEIAKVRAFLLEEGFFIMDEQMIYEEGKYYPMMKALPPGKTYVDERARDGQGPWDEVQLRYGKLLLENRHPVLKELLERDLSLSKRILQGLPVDGGERVEKRRAELSVELGYVREGLAYYEKGYLTDGFAPMKTRELET